MYFWGITSITCTPRVHTTMGQFYRYNRSPSDHRETLNSFLCGYDRDVAVCFARRKDHGQKKADSSRCDWISSNHLNNVACRSKYPNLYSNIYLIQLRAWG